MLGWEGAASASIGKLKRVFSGVVIRILETVFFWVQGFMKSWCFFGSQRRDPGTSTMFQIERFLALTVGRRKKGGTVMQGTWEPRSENPDLGTLQITVQI